MRLIVGRFQKSNEKSKDIRMISMAFMYIVAVAVIMTLIFKDL